MPFTLQGVGLMFGVSGWWCDGTGVMGLGFSNEQGSPPPSTLAVQYRINVPAVFDSRLRLELVESPHLA